jgi:hypothetical protein
MPSIACEAESIECKTTVKIGARPIPTMVMAALVSGLLIGFGTLLLKAHFSSGPALTPFQPDSLIYYQYARALAEGHPYQFTADQAPSTGSTSHLYPAALAVLYAAGAQGEWLGLASFCFGCLSLAITLVCVVWIAQALRPAAAWLALLLSVLSGPLIIAILGESDMALFAPIALGAFAAALYHRPAVLALLLFLASLCRPEGMILSALCAGGALGWILLRKSDRWGRSYFVAGGIGLLGAAAVFGLNIALTGDAGFQSMHLKGHFTQFPLVGAIQLTSTDLANVCQDILWGANRGVRSMYMLPVLGGALAVLGLLSRGWTFGRMRFCEAWILLGTLASAAIVASSGWSGFAFDRYFAWWMPLMLVYAAIGVQTLSERFGMGLRWPLAILLVGYQAVTLPYFAGSYAAENASVASRIDFARTAHRQLDEGQTVGTAGWTGLAYYMPGRSVLSFYGITSPAFQAERHQLENMESLRYEPELRFDVWLMDRKDAESPDFKFLVGEPILDQVMAPRPSAALGLYGSRWDSLKHGMQPMKKEVQSAVRDLTQVDALDIGYRAHEQSHHRTVFTRLPAMRLDPFLVEAEIGGQSFVDVGEAVFGSETFDLKAQPGRPVRLVMRTLLETEVMVAGADGGRRKHTYTLGSPLRLLVQNGDMQTGVMEFPITSATNQLDEIIIDIPAELISKPVNRITIGGDHFSCAFWAYQ